MIAEMVTGEGKTLVATLPAYLNALEGKGVHVVTVNDYLARRDMEWMGPLYMALGLTVGAIQANMDSERAEGAYACDITYGTNNEFGFDYLRDNMQPARGRLSRSSSRRAVQLRDHRRGRQHPDRRGAHAADHFRPRPRRQSKYAKADRIARQLKKDVHFEVKEKEHTCNLTDEGVREAEQLAGVESFYTAGNMEWPHLIDNSLKAHHLYKRDVNYVVEQGEVVIVDEFTGRLMPGRNGATACTRRSRPRKACDQGREPDPGHDHAAELLQALRQDLRHDRHGHDRGQRVLEDLQARRDRVPTNRPLQRASTHPDVILPHASGEKYNAVVDEIREVHADGPADPGRHGLDRKAEMLSDMLEQASASSTSVLNAKHHQREAEIVAQAGREAAVTIATNMAGRGTDIILGGNPEYMAWAQLQEKYATRLDVPKPEWDDLTAKIGKDEQMTDEGREVAELGGLHVIGTERHEARRIDLQLRGRCGRQGDPGCSRFFLSLEDDLMRIFAGEWVKNMLTRLGMQEGEAIESRMVTRRIEAAQKKVEERHFEIRKNLLEYDEVMDEQRKRVYSYRQRILDGGNCKQLILDMIDKQIEQDGAPACSSRPIAGRRSRVGPRTRWASRSTPARSTAWTAQRLEDHFRRRSRPAGRRRYRARRSKKTFPRRPRIQSEWNWLALSKWVNVRYGLNTNDRELKKIGRDGASGRSAAAGQGGDRAVRLLAAGDRSTRPNSSARRSVCGWLHQQFTLEMRPEEFAEPVQSGGGRRAGPPQDRRPLPSEGNRVPRRRRHDELHGRGSRRRRRALQPRGSRSLGQRAVPGRAARREVKDRPRNEIENLLKRVEPPILRQRRTASRRPTSTCDQA